MNVSVIVATYGDIAWSQLAQERALPSVEEQGAVQVIEHHAPLHTLARVRNTAAETAHGDWLCFLDADDELEPGYLAAMAEAERTLRIAHAPVTERRSYFDFPARALLVPRVRRVKHGAWMQPAAIPNQGRWPETNECVIGTLVPRLLFEQVGGFRDHACDGTPLVMYEDWDLFLRCWDAGAELVYAWQAVYREHVSAGRNTNTHLSQPVYDAIWRDHLARTSSGD